MQNLDVNHVLFWMDAIRNSKDPIRTLESFWKGQVYSKTWLIEQLTPFITNPVSIDICGGWNGVLASLIFQSDIPVNSIRSIDIDPLCEYVAKIMNKQEEMQGRFQAITSDMCKLKYETDVIINTSCEHISQDQYKQWLDNMPTDSLLVLQSNNYNIPEHIRISNDLDEFKNQCNVKILWAGELELPLYTRFMIIGKNE